MKKKGYKNSFQAIMAGLEYLSIGQRRRIAQHFIIESEYEFYFIDQDGNYKGPFSTEEEAFVALMAYASKVLKENDEISPSS